MTEDSDPPFEHDATLRMEEGAGKASGSSSPSSSWRSDATFKQGDVAGGRYRIVAFLGEGGMGEVYEAQDLELQDAVALKTIRSNVASDENALARFRREVQLARRVTHANVSRLFDVGSAQVRDGHGRETSVLYVTMELLRGETLAHRLGRAGPMTTAEALPVVQQICAGLAAAHDAGVIHRDFKSANVMLAGDPRSGRVRAVVTDFGLARDTSGDGKLTSTGQLMGTPAYMAPEQVDGSGITPRTDLYALGIVMYRMLSCELPFTAETPFQEALVRLQRPPRPLRELVPDLDARWEAVIDRCLARDPADRFSSAQEVSAALSDPSVSIPFSRRRKTRTAIAAALLLATVAAATGIYWLSRDRETSPPAATSTAPAARIAVKPRRTVAVLGFRNLSGASDAEWLSAAFSEMLTSELAAGEVLRTLPGDEVARLRLELGLSDAAAPGAAALKRIRANGADLVVAGSYLAVGSGVDRRIRLDVRLQDAATSETVATLTENGSEGEMIELIERSGARLRQALGVTVSSDPGAARASMPSSPRAARDYVDGLQRLRDRDATTATRLLAASIAVSPDFPLSHAALSEAWSVLGYDGKASEEAKRAFELSKNLARQERLGVEARYRAAARDWKRAEELYRSLMTFFPDDIEYGIRLIDVQSQSGRGGEALRVIAELRRMPVPVGDDSRIDLAEADVANAMGDFTTELRAGRAAAVKARARGARSFLAEARLHEAWALTQLSRYTEAGPAFAEAEAIYRDTGDRGGLALVMRRRAVAVRTGGDIKGAIRLTRNALDLYREIGSQRGIASSLGTIGVLESGMGDSERARQSMLQALAVYREIGDRTNVGWALGSIATTYQRQAKYEQAVQYHLECLEVAREVGDVNQQGVTTHNLGEVYLVQGRLEEAGRTFTSALTLFANDPGGRAYSLMALSNVHVATGDPARARKEATDARQIFRSIDDQFSIPSSTFTLAQIAAEEGKYAEATQLALESMKDFQRQERDQDVAAVRLLLARVSTLSNRPDAAAKELAAARPVVAKSEDEDIRDAMILEEARLASARGSASKKDLAALERVIASARKRGTIALAYEAELLAAAVERSLGHKGASTQRLQRLAREATAQGFRGVAARAAR